ncbi:MAG: hypothetical protein AABX73_02140 [Nanoarchaeota archaeon]|mgnify:CR=1 FL=1
MPNPRYTSSGLPVITNKALLVFEKETTKRAKIAKLEETSTINVELREISKEEPVFYHYMSENIKYQREHNILNEEMRFCWLDGTIQTRQLIKIQSRLNNREPLILTQKAKEKGEEKMKSFLLSAKNSIEVYKYMQLKLIKIGEEDKMLYVYITEIAKLHGLDYLIGENSFQAGAVSIYDLYKQQALMDRNKG